MYRLKVVFVCSCIAGILNINKFSMIFQKLKKTFAILFFQQFYCCFVTCHHLQKLAEEGMKQWSTGDTAIVIQTVDTQELIKHLYTQTLSVNDKLNIIFKEPLVCSLSFFMPFSVFNMSASHDGAFLWTGLFPHPLFISGSSCQKETCQRYISS